MSDAKPEPAQPEPVQPEPAKADTTKAEAARAARAEEITRLLKVAVSRRRPWTFGSALVALAVLVLPPALVAWWVWPRRPPPQLVVVTFDQAAPPGAALELRAQMEALDPDADEDDLVGREVHVEEAKIPGLPGDPPQVGKADSGADGAAAVPWKAPAEGAGEFVFRHAGSERRPASEDRARVFTWPPDTPLLLIDGDRTLTAEPNVAWQTVNAQNIHTVQPQPAAAAALQAAAAKKYQVVYLAPGPDRATAYRKLRDWVGLRSAPEEKLFPAGPVLGRPAYTAAVTAAEARRKVLAELKERFPAKMVGVAGSVEAAEAFRAAGLTTFLLSAEAAVPPGVTRLAFWNELTNQLP
jgi:hypothetical protein